MRSDRAPNAGPKGLNGAKRVFPHKGRGEIERGKDDNRLFREAEIGPAKRCRRKWSVNRNWRSDHCYRRIDEGGQRIRVKREGAQTAIQM